MNKETKVVAKVFAYSLEGVNNIQDILKDAGYIIATNDSDDLSDDPYEYIILKEFDVVEF